MYSEMEMENKWPLPDSLELPIYFQGTWGDSFRIIKVIDPQTQLVICCMRDQLNKGLYLYSLSREALTEQDYFNLLKNYSLSTKENFLQGLQKVETTLQKACKALCDTK
jgi:hypothetical protein